nr:PREDICTED: caspase-1-like [Bemisia tabaci]XP_018914009.1 PREDICTED: caspase-1-like [Bemisia tabaci]XP_018914010.1 PREDICTED: caspase-1-like [Bemisia tabaci]XP_018914011.1 PREDICTED: caspase-1-like [Bemisia tabaci]
MEAETDLVETLTEKTTAITINGTNGSQVVMERQMTSSNADHKTVEIFKFEQHIDKQTTYQDFNDEDIDDEVFVEEEVASRPRPRERRISDVIDCIGTPPSPSLFSKRHSFNDFPLPLGSPVGRNVPIVMHPSTSDFNLKGNFGLNGKGGQSPPSATAFNFCSPPSTPFSDGGYGSIGVPTPPPPSALANRSASHFRYSTTSVEMVTTNDQVDAKPIVEHNPPPSERVPCIEASMPVHADSEEYNMNHARRGKAIIFNHDKFTMANMKDRIGSSTDVKNLNAVFTNLGFEVFIYENLEWTKMEYLLHNLSQEDHSDADCLVVIVLTHGLGPTYLVSGDVPYPVESLWTPFTADKCVTLAGKPKLFFIQACRGDKLDGGLNLVSRTQTDSGKAGYKIPTHADFLLAFSTFEGFFSFRHPENGTWFIQSLCEELNAHGTSMDLLKLLTRVSRRVAINFQSYNDSQPWFDEQKQVPSINSMLIRDVYFRPKRPAIDLSPMI